MNQDDTLPASNLLDGFGERLHLAISYQRISQSEFAKRANTSPGFVSDLVRGVKKPGADFLVAVREVFGVSVDWLLTGRGTMHGNSGVDLGLLRAIRLQVAVAKAAVLDADPTAKALLLLIRDGRMQEASADADVAAYLDKICPEDVDFNLVAELYNGHIGTTDPDLQLRNMLAAAVAHYESRKPVDKWASLARASGAKIQINIGTNVSAAFGDFRKP